MRLRKSGLPKSFLIHIIFTKNKTWQGRVSCASWSKEKSFGSLLELIEIIQEEINIDILKEKIVSPVTKLDLSNTRNKKNDVEESNHSNHEDEKNE